MMQSLTEIHCFRLGQQAYRRISLLSWLMASGILCCATLALFLCVTVWQSYDHTFTFYLKWQDALVALSAFTTFLTLGGIALIFCFLLALRSGYKHYMITLEGSLLTARDLSPLNLASIFWMMNSVFWCAVVVVIGLFPAILIGWTLHLSSPALSIVLTTIVGILCLAGLAASTVAAVFIGIGCIGAFKSVRKLGDAHRYELSSRTNVSIDNFELSIIHPGRPESMIDLNLLAKEDRHQLLALLHERWIDTEKEWNPELGEEINAALQEVEDGLLATA
jgi:hypothetical protein